MSLANFFEEEGPKPLQTHEEKIKQRRSQMLIHSYLYYAMDSAIVDDAVWQKWANELVILQKRTKKIDFYDEEFSDWDASTGFHLSKDDWVVSKATYILQAINKNREA